MLYFSDIRMREMPAEDTYLREIPAVRQLFAEGGIRFEKPVTFLVGENGSGKSTLLEAFAAAYGMNPEGGSRDYAFATDAAHSALYRSMQIIRRNYPQDSYFLRAESFYNVATYLEESGSLMTRYGGRSLHVQSHGEAFFTLMTERFTGKGLYLLDEPEAALSPMRQMSMLTVLHDLVQRDAQFVIATHSPILTAYPDAEILLCSEEGITKTAYQDTTLYQLTKRFLMHPEQMLRHLLDDVQDGKTE